jgi:hypothetical protein
MTSSTVTPASGLYRKTLTLAEVSALLSRPLEYGRIDFRTATHKVSIVVNLDGDVIVNKEAREWDFGSEVRRGRPRDSYVINPSISYLKRLAR